MERNQRKLTQLIWLGSLLVCSCQGDQHATGLVQAPAAPEFAMIDDSQAIKGSGATDSFNVDDERVLTVNSKMNVHLWKFDGSAKLQLLSSYRKDWSCWHYAYSPSNSLLAFPTENCNGLYFHRIKRDDSFEQVKFLDWSDRIKKGPTVEVGFSPDGTRFAYSSYHTKSIEVIGTDAYKPALSISHKEYVDYLQFLDDDLLFSISQDDKARIWKLSKDDSTLVIESVIPKDGWNIMDVSYDSKNKSLLVWYGLPKPYIGFSEVQVAKNGSVKHNKVKPNTGDGILVLRTDPNRKYVVVGTTESELIIFDYDAWKEAARFTLKDAPASVLFRKNGDQFLVGCLNGYTSLFVRKAGCFVETPTRRRGA